MREELLELIKEVQEHQSERDYIEVKKAKNEVPKRIFEPISAFANRSEGGVILLGLDDERGFEITGVNHVAHLQEAMTQYCVDLMEPPVKPEFSIQTIEGQKVMAVEIPGSEPIQRPFYYKTAGLQKGSYVRIGNTNRQMTDYEILAYMNAKSSHSFDDEVVPNATVDSLDNHRVQLYLSSRVSARPHAEYLTRPLEALQRLGVIRSVDGIMRPTLAALLVFGDYPQEFEPQIVITYLRYAGITEQEKGPRGERFIDNQKFDGPLPEMIERALAHILANIRNSSLITGLFRRDIPEYPREAIREAIVNAVAHRDYSPMARGSYVQIRQYADRLEIQSPGGLFGTVTEENIEEHYSTRNKVLMRLLEELNVAENRGSGISAMIGSMREANLQPPLFQDRTDSFLVTFSNHSLMSPDTIRWLNQFRSLPINERQQLALAYLRLNERITNSVYRRLNYVDLITANKELHGLVQTGAVGQHGTRRWTEYSLTVVPQEIETPSTAVDQEETILEYVNVQGSITRSECQRLLGVGENRARYLLKVLTDRGLLRIEGKRRGAKYVPTRVMENNS